MTLTKYLHLITQEIHDGARPFSSDTFPVIVNVEVSVIEKDGAIIVSDDNNSTRLTFKISVSLN